jgi:Ala-tRNA(Pro) deacylase
MPARRLKEFLDRYHTKYVSISHSPAYTAQEIAALVHIPGQDLAKTVIVNLDDQPAMAVLPASRQLDLALLKEASGAAKVELATEAQFKDLFPDCETGAMPPFGNLYDLPVYVAQKLTHDDEIAFNAGTHSELIRMSYADFERLVQPIVVRVSAAAAAR